MENFKKGTKEKINPSVKKSTGKGTFYQMNYNGAVLSSIAKDIAKGEIPCAPPREFSLNDTSLALDSVKSGVYRGKTVIRMK